MRSLNAEICRLQLAAAIANDIVIGSINEWKRKCACKFKIDLSREAKDRLLSAALTMTTCEAMVFGFETEEFFVQSNVHWIYHVSQKEEISLSMASALDRISLDSQYDMSKIAAEAWRQVMTFESQIVQIVGEMRWNCVQGWSREQWRSLLQVDLTKVVLEAQLYYFKICQDLVFSTNDAELQSWFESTLKKHTICHDVLHPKIPDSIHGLCCDVLRIVEDYLIPLREQVWQNIIKSR